MITLPDPRSWGAIGCRITDLKIVGHGDICVSWPMSALLSRSSGQYRSLIYFVQAKGQLIG